MNNYNTICTKCNGLIAQPNQTYGYSGSFCNCISQNFKDIGLSDKITELATINERIRIFTEIEKIDLPVGTWFLIRDIINPK